MLTLSGISKSYVSPVDGTTIPVLSGISLHVQRGEIVSLYGPNGCGKSTLLKIVSGNLSPCLGSVKYESERNRVGFVWQNYSGSLLPWYTVEQNIELPAVLSNGSIKIGNKASDILEKLCFQIPEGSFPSHLSGGQQQMVAIARALSNDPSVLLLDEPFSALDKTTRERTASVIREYCVENDPMSFFVSHSLDESILFADRLVLFSELPGRILGTIKIEFSSNRTLDLLTSLEFIELRNKALTIINNGSEI